MAEYQHIVSYNNFSGSIVFPPKISSFVITHFAAAVRQWQRRRPNEPLTLDFTKVKKAYPNGMVPIIAVATDLRLRGHTLTIRLPFENGVRRLFLNSNWAHFLSPFEFRQSESIHDRHMVTKQFSEFGQLPQIVNDFMDVVLRNMVIPKDVLSGLEWSMNELCDNVINHSESKIGGFAEAVTFTKERVISFTVADCGRGILNSLREALPTLQTSQQAIGEALKAGVTRNVQAGQGNGLAGSLRITTMTGGSLDITSGAGRIYTTFNSTNQNEGNQSQFYFGTSVSGNIRTDKKFSISEALNFGGDSYTPLNIIDLKYEIEDEDCMLMMMAQETTGVGTRKSGKQLRTKIINLIQSRPGFPIKVDWSGIPVISSSFGDEFMGKLFLELGPISFSNLIRNRNMEPLVKQLLDKAISQRLTQEN